MVPYDGIYAERWGQSDSFLHISVIKKSRSLGEGNGPLNQKCCRYRAVRPETKR